MSSTEVLTGHLGRYLPRSTFPADRSRLICQAHRSGAPDEVVALLRRLDPPGHVFADVDELCYALGTAWQHRGG